MRSLKLILKKIWFDMISSGVKLEEYRELTPYYLNRLLQRRDGGKIDELLVDVGRYQTILKKGLEVGSFVCKHKHVTFYEGYKHDRREMLREIESITIGEGKPEWGAEPGKEYFVIKLKK